MVRIAVTGGIASGKSLVASFLREEGVHVWDADELAHELMEPGRPLFQAVVQAFGADILAADGTINRQRLGAMVFADKEKLQRLNAITHPVIRAAWEERLRAVEMSSDSGTRVAKPADCAAVIVPLLYEAGLQQGWDAVVCVVDTERRQLERLRARGLSEEEARQRITAQMPLWQKAELADYVIVNAGSREVLREQTRRVLRHIRRT
ncbi:MAG: dephospho-CoA kinase [Kiritimatiellia bacterium]